MQLYAEQAIPLWGIRSMALRPDGRQVVVGTSDGHLGFWDVPSLRCLRLLERAPREEYRHIEGLAWTPDGQALLCATVVRYQLQWWEAPFTTPFELLYAGPRSDDDVRGYLAWDGFQPKTPQVDPMGRWLLCGGGRGRLRCWELATMDLRWERVAGDPYEIIQVAISPDGMQVATAGYQGTLAIRELATGEGIALCPIALDDCRGVAWSPDGREVICVGYARDHRREAAATWHTLQRWDPATGTMIASYPCTSPWGDSIATHPTQPVVAMGDSNRMITLWETETWTPQCQIDGKADTIAALAWTPDGQYLISAGYGRTRGQDDHLVVWRFDGSPRPVN